MTKAREATNHIHAMADCTNVNSIDCIGSILDNAAMNTIDRMCFSEEQLKEVEEAKKEPIVFDEDCEELSDAMIKAFQCAVGRRNRRKLDA